MVRRHDTPRRWTPERDAADRARRTGRTDRSRRRQPARRDTFYFDNVYRRFPVLRVLVRFMREDANFRALVDRLVADSAHVVPENLSMSQTARDMIREIAELFAIQQMLANNVINF